MKRGRVLSLAALLLLSIVVVVLVRERQPQTEPRAHPVPAATPSVGASPAPPRAVAPLASPSGCPKSHEAQVQARPYEMHPFPAPASSTKPSLQATRPVVVCPVQG